MDKVKKKIIVAILTDLMEQMKEDNNLLHQIIAIQLETEGYEEIVKAYTEQIISILQRD